MARPKKRQTLSEAEYLIGELMVMTSKDSAGVYYVRDIKVSATVNHIKACCVITECESSEEATQLAEAIEEGLRLPPDEDEVTRKWPGLKKGNKNVKKKESRIRSCLRSLSNI